MEHYFPTSKPSGKELLPSMAETVNLEESTETIHDSQPVQMASSLPLSVVFRRPSKYMSLCGV
nr:hypothetical protein PHYPA_006240 [Physcomitrium patens]